MVFAVKEANKKSHVSEVSNEVARVRGYVEGFPKFKKNLKNFLDAKSAAGKIVMYGCGARSCNFINLLDLGGYFTFFIDDQREKQGKFCPGNRIPIVSSEVLSADMSVALGVNAESEANVIKKHHLKDFFSVLPPSRHLPEFWRNFVR
jgi:hypothetical protein